MTIHAVGQVQRVGRGSTDRGWRLSMHLRREQKLSCSRCFPKQDAFQKRAMSDHAAGQAQQAAGLSVD